MKIEKGRQAEDCKKAQLVAPLIDRNRCEGKKDCEAVCPYDVFEIKTVLPSDKEKLSWLGKLKLRVHGGIQAYVRDPDLCHACGLCVTACPEKAVTLLSRS